MPSIMADWGLRGLLSPLLPDPSTWHSRPEPAIAVLSSLALLFIWYCYRVGTGQVAPVSHQHGVPTEEGCPRRTLRGDAINQRLYRSLRDYAKRYSWSGMNRLHKGIRDQAHYQLGERLAIQKPSAFYLPDLPSAPYFPRESQRHDVEILELSFPAILQEFEGIAWDFEPGAPMPRGWMVNANPGWHSYYLYRQGECIAQNCRSCPWTYRALSALRTFINANCFGNACFNVLQPGTVLPGTYGPTNTRVRCHLGLKVPPGCELVVGGEPQCWSEGYCLLVDDSFLHTTAHNGSPSDGPQVIFIADLWHPNVAGPERQALDYIFAPGR
ncbi:aspartate beta-hydroxylase domain-containing protein 1 [Python bivittatus]|uniref:Aspartate beta-hydroxylase domain-containing protein 1 n=2 Tax=Serpentes TaxID=8570 RepID=A0A9F5IR12_PYTBI|nr:aspartate beta-hydroxylase domain-containing protein 1 [Python bivittatus]